MVASNRFSFVKRVDAGRLNALIHGIPNAQLLDMYGHAIPCYDTTIDEKIDSIYT